MCDDVTSTSQERGAHRPTQRQRALYLSRGGLSDGFSRDTLKLDPEEFHPVVKTALDELSRKTHVRPNCASDRASEKSKNLATLR